MTGPSKTTFAADRPDWTLGGARFVPDAEPFERLKLRMVNGTHSSLAYLGAMAGWQTVDHAIGQAPLRDHIEALMRDEIEPTLPALPGLDLAAYRTNLLARYANPALAHRTQQIAMDGSQKLPQRLLGTVRDRLAQAVADTAHGAGSGRVDALPARCGRAGADLPHRRSTRRELTALYAQSLGQGASPGGGAHHAGLCARVWRPGGQRRADRCAGARCCNPCKRRVC